MQKKLKDTSTLAAITKQPFCTFSTLLDRKEEFEYTRLLPILVAINEYNRFMGRVDIANQLWATFSTH
jgi:hypothetical protein